MVRIERNLNSNKYNCEVPKSFSIFKAFVELSFSRIIHSHMLQRLFEISLQLNVCNYFLGSLIRGMCSLLSTFGIWLVAFSFVIRVLLLQKTNFGCTYKQYRILFHKQTFKICLTPCHLI